MARETLLRSDKSGDVIEPGTGARVRILWSDDRPDYRADLTGAEAEELIKRYKLVATTPRPERRR